MADAPVARAGIAMTWRESPPAVKALLAGTLVNRLGEFVQIFMVLYLIARGFTATQAGAALGVYGAGAVFGVLIGGWLTDRIGARSTIIYSMVTAAVLVPTVLFLNSYVGILAVLGLAAATGQAYRPASTSLLSQLTPPTRQVMIFAMCRLAINLGASAGPLIGAALITVSYDLLFWGEAVAALALAAIAAVALPPARAGTEAGGRVGSGAAEEEGATASGAGGYLAVLADRRYLLFLFAMFASSVIYIQYLSTLPLTVRDRGLSTTAYGVLLAINGMLVIACELLVARSVQRWQPRVAVVAGVALTAVGMSLYGVPWGMVGLVLATLVWSLGEIIGYPTLFFAYPAQAGPPRLRGRYLGASNSLYGLGCSIGPVIGILLWNRIGDAVWLLCGAVGLVAVAAAWTGVQVTHGSTAPATD